MPTALLSYIIFLPTHLPYARHWPYLFFIIGEMNLNDKFMQIKCYGGGNEYGTSVWFSHDINEHTIFIMHLSDCKYPIAAG